MSYKKWSRAVEDGPGAVGRKAVFFLFGFTVLISCLIWLYGILSQPGRILAKTFDADNVIYNYEWFKDRNQEILALDAKIKSAKSAVAVFEASAGKRKEWDREDKIEHSRLSSVHLGLRQQRNDAAAEYNARSKMANRKIFKSGELPTQISIEE